MTNLEIANRLNLIAFGFLSQRPTGVGVMETLLLQNRTAALLHQLGVLEAELRAAPAGSAVEVEKGPEGFRPEGVPEAL